MKREHGVLLGIVIALTLITGCTLKELSIPCKVEASDPPTIGAMPIVTDPRQVPPTTEFHASGNLNANTPRHYVKLAGTILDSGSPSPSYAQFIDAFGNERTLKITFNRLAFEPTRSLAYTVQAVTSLTDDSLDPQVTVTMPGTNNYVKFSTNGNPNAPVPSDFNLKITRTPIAGETTAPNYSMDVPVDAWELFQSSTGATSLQASMETNKDCVPNYVLFGGRLIDLLGSSHLINIRATPISADTWLIRPDSRNFDNTVCQVDCKLGEGFFVSYSPDRPDAENYPALVRFDLSTGRIISGKKTIYRFHLSNVGVSEIALDLSNVTCISGENTASVVGR